MSLDTRHSDANLGNVPANVDKYACPDCGYTAATERALASHRRKKHGLRHQLADLIGTSNICPVCAVAFPTRSRLMAHVADRRVRGSRATTCHNILKLGVVKPRPSDEVQASREIARSEHKSSYARGHSQAIAKTHNKAEN